MPFHRSSKLIEMVTSLTGNARSPFSIQKPPARLGREHGRDLASRHLARAELGYRTPRRLDADFLGGLQAGEKAQQATSVTR
jgi:hypothetical protein